MDADAQEEWNPSWSDEEVELSVPDPGSQNKGYYKNQKGPPEEEATDCITDNDASERDEANLFRRKFYNKEELFKNLTGSKSNEETKKTSRSSGISRNNGKNPESNSYSSISRKSREPADYARMEAVNDSSRTIHPVNYNSDEHKCRECGKVFTKKLHLTLHEKIHAKMDRPSKHVRHDNTTERRSEANENLKNSNQALYRIINVEEEKLVCEKCDRCFERINQLKFHRKLCKAALKTSLTGQQKPPQQLKPDPRDSSLLEEFADNHITSNLISNSPALCEKKFSCTDCGREFKLQHSLNLHKRSHFRTCSSCSLTFHETVFKEHFSLCYSPASEIPDPTRDLMTCTTCSKRCANEAALSEHHVLHKYSIETFEDGNSDYFNYFLPFECQQKGCESRFSANYDLDNHLRKKHNVETRGVSNPTYYYIQDQQLPPLNPYVLIAQEIKRPADALLKKTQNSKRVTPTVLSPTHLNRRLKKARGIQPRIDIPFQNFYICEICDKRFHKRNVYLIHIAVHKREKFPCELCERRFQSESSLEAHVKLHSDPNYVPRRVGGRFRDDIPIQDEYTCEECGEKFDKRNLYLLHLREEKYKCTFCDRRFQSESLLEAHVKLHSDPNYVPRGVGGRFRDDIPIQDEYTCEECGEKFKKRNQYLLHLREEKFKCTFCDRRFQSESVFKAHIDLHSDPNYVPRGVGGRVRDDVPFQDEYTCEECGEKFDKRNLYLLHLREEKYKCTLCDRRFQSEGPLKAHVKLHSDPNYVSRPGRRYRDDIPFQDEYTCEECGEKFKKRNLYLIHLREEKFKCTICDRRFQSESLFKAHVDLHSDPNYVPGRAGRVREDVPFQDEYTCEECGEKFDKRNLYLLHLREEKYKCTLCDRRFQSEGLLEAHVKRHSDPNYVPGRKRFRDDIPIQSIYTCETCEKQFKERSNFLIHLSQHRREEMYKCKLCGMKHLSSLSLKHHMKRHADPDYVPGTGRGRGRFRHDIPIQSIYTCEKCEKQFEDRHVFLIHLNNHEKETKFICKLCGMRHVSMISLKLHMKRHSNPAYVPGRRGRPIQLDLHIPIQSIYSCEKCETKFEDRNLFLLHIAKHRREDRFACNICHMKHVSPYALQQHMKRHSDPTYSPRRPRSSIPVQDVYNCESCDRTFVNRQSYICHLYYHRHGGNKTNTGNVRRKKRSDIPVQDVYYCEQCGYSKAFTDRIKYIIHLNNHSLEKCHKCDGCLKQFKTVHARDAHQQKFCKGIPCKYKCDRCKEMFHSKIMLYRHFEKYHSKSLTSSTATIEYPCNQCSQTFNTTFGLTRHQQVYHPVADVILEHDSPKVTDDDYQDNSGENSSHSWSPEEDNPVLAASFCETELNEIPSVEEKSQGKAPPKRKPSRVCQCGVNKKYKSQKFCHSLRCPCVQAGNRCSKDCDCDSACLNNNEMEDQQQQKFKEGKVSMMLEDGVNNDEEEMNASTPVVIGYSDDPFEDNYPDAEQEPCASTSSLGYSKLIPTSEFITIDEGQDESMRQLSIEGYVEGAEEVDPLADPLSAPQISQKPEKPFSTNNSTLIVNTATSKPQNKIHTVGNSVSTSPAVISASGSTSSKQSNIEASLNSFTNQTANLRCQFCKKNFKIMPTYISHILLHHEVEKASLSCSICSQTFDNQITSYIQHLDSHNKGIDLQCTKCSSRFKSYGDMDKHLRVHHFQPMQCGICQMKFPNSEVMMSHWSKVHPTCQCGLCNVKFFSYDDLTFHMKSLHSPYDCLRCNDRFENLRKLLDHFVTAHSSIGSARTHSQTNREQNNFKCDHCDACFSNGEDLNEHLSNHLSSPQSVPGETRNNHHQCGQCKATFTSTEDLHDHLAHHIMGTNQTNDQSYKLRNASGGTGSNDVPMSMTDDVIEVEQVMDDPVNDNIQAVEVLTCPKCGKSFRNRNAWRIHMLSHKLIVCSACDSSFDTKEELLDHLRINSCLVHFCEICDRNFQAKKYLSQHKKFVHAEKRSSVDNMHSGETGSFTGQQNDTGENARIVHENSFPVIVASTSLAENRSAQAQPTAYILNSNTYPSFNARMARTQDEVPREIEEIVLD